MIEYRTLKDTQSETLHTAFIEAFSDYQVELDLPIEKFAKMLQRRGYAPELSIGAFTDTRLVGFVLNGRRSWNGKPTLYDCGTGVVPEFRKQGITSTAFNQVLELIQANRIEQYLLEVIQSNTPAVSLYQKQGFRITRNFACFQIDRHDIETAPLTPTATSVHFESCLIDELDWTLLKTFWDFEPSWQNSIESMTADKGSCVALIARAGEATLGYGIIEKSSGDIPQLAVQKELRRRGIGAELLRRLIQHTESDQAVLLNIDDACPSMHTFLQALGFEHFIGQYEMLLDGKFAAESSLQSPTSSIRGT